MQSPTATTPVSKCLDLASYTVRMCGKYPANAALASIATKLGGAAGALDGAQAGYAAAVRAILPARVDVKFENHVADRRIRLTQQKAEIADGKKNGAVASHVFPGGSAVIIRLLGQSQVDAMIALEGRLAAVAPVWADATQEQQAIAQLRQGYAAALAARTKAAQDAAALRSARDVAKDQFLTAYAEAQGLVQAEFPRDTVQQDLLFDDVRTRSSAAQADDSGTEEPKDEPSPDKGSDKNG